MRLEPLAEEDRPPRLPDDDPDTRAAVTNYWGTATFLRAAPCRKAAPSWALPSELWRLICFPSQHVSSHVQQGRGSCRRTVSPPYRGRDICYCCATEK